ncbi:hypothetical protein JL720_8309 [Aureococcus anophagefferens]|nr:hypothetical protein JL720_8309 [Aureococcus anophagefferens]
MDISVEDERDPEKMRQILARMTPGEEDRFEHYRRSRFNRTGISQIMRRSLADDARVDENSAVVVAALAKMFAGDLGRPPLATRRGGEEGEPIGPAEFAAAARTLQLQDRPVVGDHKRPGSTGRR